MRLKKSQKELVLKWIAEGLESDEINARAAALDDSFSVLRSQIAYYRKSRDIDVTALRSVAELDALTEGLALKSERVRKLQQLAAMLESDLFGGFLWTENAKGIGSGDAAVIYDFEEFNKAEIDAYRGVLDDIAKEVGDRVQKQEVTGKDGGPIKTDDEGRNRTLSTLAYAIRETLSGTGAIGQGAVDAAEQTAMARTPVEGG